MSLLNRPCSQLSRGKNEPVSHCCRPCPPSHTRWQLSDASPALVALVREPTSTYGTSISKYVLANRFVEGKPDKPFVRIITDGDALTFVEKEQSKHPKSVDVIYYDQKIDGDITPDCKKEASDQCGPVCVILRDGSGAYCSKAMTSHYEVTFAIERQSASKVWEPHASWKSSSTTSTKGHVTDVDQPGFFFTCAFGLALRMGRHV